MTATVWSVFKNLRYADDNKGADRKMRGRFLGRIIVFGNTEGDIFEVASKKWPGEVEKDKPFGGFFFLEYTPGKEGGILKDAPPPKRVHQKHSALTRGVRAFLEDFKEEVPVD